MTFSVELRRDRDCSLDEGICKEQELVDEDGREREGEKDQEQRRAEPKPPVDWKPERDSDWLSLQS